MQPFLNSSVEWSLKACTTDGWLVERIVSADNKILMLQRLTMNSFFFHLFDLAGTFKQIPENDHGPPKPPN